MATQAEIITALSTSWPVDKETGYQNVDTRTWYRSPFGEPHRMGEGDTLFYSLGVAQWRDESSGNEPKAWAHLAPRRPRRRRAHG